MRKDFYLWKRGKVWQCQFRDPSTDGILTPVSTGETNHTRAEAWARGEYDRKLDASKKSPLTLREWSAPFFQKKGCPHKERTIDEKKPYSEKTRRDSLRYLEVDILTDPIADMVMVDISRADLVQFRVRLIARRGRCRAADRAFRVLCILLRDAVHYGKIPYDPTALLGGVKYDVKERTAVGAADMARLFDPKNWVDPVARLAAKTAALVGLRAGEVIALRWGSVDPDRRIVSVVASYTDLDGEGLPKWKKVRSSAYPGELKEELEPLRGKPDEYVFSIAPGTHISYTTLSKHFKLAAASAGLQGLTLHGLRHSGQTALREKGISPELLRASYGWADSRTQDGYTHRELYDLSPISDAIDEIFGGSHG